MIHPCNLYYLPDNKAISRFAAGNVGVERTRCKVTRYEERQWVAFAKIPD